MTSPAPSKRQSQDTLLADRTVTPLATEWDVELFWFSNADKQGLLDAIRGLQRFLATADFDAPSGTLNAASISLKNLAYSLNAETKKNLRPRSHTLVLLASSVAELSDKLERSCELLASDPRLSFTDERGGMYYTAPEAVVSGQVAFMYPGLGSAYTNMLAELRVHLPEVRHVFEVVDAVALSSGATMRPSELIFANTDSGSAIDMQSLAQADFAVVAVLLAEYALYEVLRKLEVIPHLLIGCSTGEFASLTTGGAIEVLSAANTFYRLSTRLAKQIEVTHLPRLRSLHAFCSWRQVQELVSDEDEIYLAANLGPEHIVVTGDILAMDRLLELLRVHRKPCFPMSVPVPYHTPLVDGVIDSNSEAVRSIEIGTCHLPAFACSTAALLPVASDSIRSHLTELFTKPIELTGTIRAAYAAGARIFVEVGPNNVLTQLLRDILPVEPHVAVATNVASRSSLSQLHHLLAVLLTHAIPVNLDYLYENREVELIDLTESERLSLPSGGLNVQTSDVAVQTFLTATANFYGNLSAVQESVIKAYLNLKAAETPAHPFSWSRMNVDIEQSVCAILVESNIRGLEQTRPFVELWLTAREQHEFYAANKSESRRFQWLIGRLAAKQAIIALASELFNQKLQPLDLEILRESSGRPQVIVREASVPWGVSIAHSGKLALALATPASSGCPGVDIETVRTFDPDIYAEFLSKNEQQYVHSLDGYLQAAHVTRLWAVKEASFKAFGGGHRMSLFRLAGASPSPEKVLVQHPAADESSFQVQTSVFDNYVCAFTVV